MSDVTIREASVLTGKSRQTINNACNNGKISFTLNKRDHKVIAISELSREFDLINPIDDLTKPKGKEVSKAPVKSSKIDSQIQSIKEDLLSAHRRERDLMQDQIDLLKTTVEEIRKDKETYVRLIENQGQGGEKYKEEIQKLSDANQSLSEQMKEILELEQERKAQEKMEQRRQARKTMELQKQKEEEANKGFFAKLFS